MTHRPAAIGSVTWVTAPDSATIEDAMDKREVDVVWRGLNAAAVTRFSQQVGASPDKVTTTGFAKRTLGGTRVELLQWSPRSAARKSASSPSIPPHLVAADSSSPEI